MDYQGFIEQLPNLYEDWDSDAVRPKSNQFDRVLNCTNGIITANVMQLLNFAVECMAPDEIYCEVGTNRGATLISALLNRPEVLAYAVDNFSNSDLEAEKVEELIENLTQFNLEEQVYFYNQDFEEFFLELRQVEFEQKIGVYWFDGSHNYRAQLMALFLAKPFLAKQALIVVCNANRGEVQQACWDFVAANFECKVELECLFKPEICLQVLSWNANRTYNYPAEIFEQKRQQPLIQAISKVSTWQRNLETSYQNALHYHQQNELVLAEKEYQRFLFWENDHIEAHKNLGKLYYQLEKYQESLIAFLKVIELDPMQGEAYYFLGLCYQKFHQFERAIAAFKTAVELDPELIDAYRQLGHLLYQQDQTEDAKAIFRIAIANYPDRDEFYLILAYILIEDFQIDSAIEVYHQALNLNPSNYDILAQLEAAIAIKNDPATFLRQLNNNLYHQNRYLKVIERTEKYLEIAEPDAELYFQLAESYWNTHQGDIAIDTLKTAVKAYPTSAQLQFSLILKLLRKGETAEAISTAETASNLLPEDYTFKLLKYLSVPTVYHTPDEIEYYRQRFTQGLDRLIQETNLDQPERQQSAFSATGRVTNFYLGYQAHNVVNLQRLYGQLLHKIMTANFPQWGEALSMPPVQTKIKIGYVSHYLHAYSGTLWLTGWLRYANHHDFEIYCYYTGNLPDPVTQQFQSYSDKFYQIPAHLPAVCQQIRDDNLHILIFPEIGMDPPTMQLAALRLAPVQCVAWGHPVTTGLPTIDYFLSSELMEPEHAQAHYSEHLIKLPNIGVAYPKPTDIPQLTKTREDFNLPEESVLYLCCQAPYKYLPQYDYILPEIALKVPNAKFVFLRGTPLKERLERAFAAVGLHSEDYCLHLTIPERSDYLAINLLSDVFLDTFTWSGGNTTLEAIACNLPIVTCPGEFMRGRHADSFLKLLGVTDTIAQNEAEYIEIAAQLGLSPQWRQDISQRMSQLHDRLFDDRACVIALESFYQQVVRERLNLPT